MTSHDVIYKIRKMIAAKKVGHTGTLDPMASGLLMICMGRATKLTQFLTEWDKSYLAEITLGATSDTLDGEGKITPVGEVPDLSQAALNDILSKFTGRITQKVPAYSAVKVAGKELYKYAHKGIDVDTPSREIEIEKLEVMSYKAPCLTILVKCSKGTYIRVLADDIGREIGCGAYLSGLERQSVGPYEISGALSLDQVKEHHQNGDLDKFAFPIEQVLDFPVISIRSRVRSLIKNGGTPDSKDVIGYSGDFESGDLISMADETGEIMAIGKSKCNAASFEARKDTDFFSYVRVLI